MATIAVSTMAKRLERGTPDLVDSVPNTDVSKFYYYTVRSRAARERWWGVEFSLG